MGRRSKSRALSVWMNGQLVGEWRWRAGNQEFVYAESWFASSAARPISLSLPLRPSREPYRDAAEAFFDNLLPDNRQIRERIQRRFRTPTTGAFDLLHEIGRDCVGALQLLPAGETPQDIRKITAEKLTGNQVAEALTASLNTTPFSEENYEDGFRISLAGAQEKTALLLHEGVWQRPTHTTPTTHILKLPLGTNQQGIDLSTSVENEWLCAQIVKAYGLEAAACKIETFGQYKTLVVERFDRRMAPDATWYLRLPQEDLCQATATRSALKYESDGGPGIERIMSLLLGSDLAAQDRRSFMLTQVVFWMLAAIDGHAKNFSFFLLPGGSYRLTPRYDILSAHPILGHGHGKLAPEKIRMAMAVNGKSRHYRWQEIHARHWIETGKRNGLENMRSILEEVVERTPEALGHARGFLPTGFPANVAESIVAGTQSCARQLADELSGSVIAVS